MSLLEAPDMPNPHAASDTGSTPLGRAPAPQRADHSTPSGVVALGDGREVVAVRALWATAAERSIDILAFIWQDDATGAMLFGHRAADPAAAARGREVDILAADRTAAAAPTPPLPPLPPAAARRGLD